MPIIFLNSAVQIFDRLVPFLEKEEIDNITFVIPVELSEFFKKFYNDSQIIVPKVHPNLITTKTKHKIFINTIKANREYKQLFSNIRDETIYVFALGWSVVFFYYITKLKKQGNNVVIILSENQMHFKRGKGFIPLFMRVYAKYILGVPNHIQMGGGGNKIVPTWVFDFEKINPEKIIKMNSNNLELPERLKTHIIKGLKVLFIGQQIHCEGADFNSVTEVTDRLMDILDERFKESYAVKAHPRVPYIYGRMKNAKHILNKNIIIETLLFYPWDYIIGYYSTSLERAKQFSNAKVISLINLIEWNDPLKQFWKKKFKTLDIIMPSSFEELEKELTNE